MLPTFPAGPRSAPILRTYLRSLADATAQEAGLYDAGPLLTACLQAAQFKRPWRGINLDLARAAASLRDLAERPLSLAVPVKE